MAARPTPVLRHLSRIAVRREADERAGEQAHAADIDNSHHLEPTPMYANFAAGTLIVLGVLITVLGLFAAGEMLVVVVGLAAVLAGGMLGAIAARRPA